MHLNASWSDGMSLSTWTYTFFFIQVMYNFCTWMPADLEECPCPRGHTRGFLYELCTTFAPECQLIWKNVPVQCTWTYTWFLKSYLCISNFCTWRPADQEECHCPHGHTREACLSAEGPGLSENSTGKEVLELGTRQQCHGISWPSF